MDSRSLKIAQPVALGMGLVAAVVMAWIRLNAPPAAPEVAAPPEPASVEGERKVYDLTLARHLFAAQLDNEPLAFDPQALLVRKPDQRSLWYWEEHPRGKFRVWTNDLGFNEAEPTRRTTPDVRILVAGDSHTQGVVDMDESFANVLEALLRKAEAGRSVDVLNAGVAYTGPRCYLGMLRRCLELGLRPDVFVAALFLGNDLHDELRLERALREVREPGFPEGYLEPLLLVSEAARGPVSQGFNQLYRYRHFPGEADEALALVIDAYERMKELCDAQGILLVALVVPTKMDVDLGDDREVVSWCQKELGLSDEAMNLHLAASRRFVTAMQERGILCVDPTEAMKSADTPSYWRRDYHLNVAGHRLVAERLNEALAGRL